LREMPERIRRDGSSLSFKRLGFSKEEFTKRRRDEKNSAQPCFPVLHIPPSPFMRAFYKDREQGSVSF
jgi:hypothetical protein